MRTKAPTSLKVALAQMRRGATLDFAECMRTEFRIVSRVVRGHDFYEGVRAVIIDKDQAPQWQPATLAAVDMAAVELLFPQIYGGNIWVIVTEVVLLGVYLWLALMAAREQPG